MKVSGENTFLYQLTGQQKFDEATVQREGGFGFFGLFGSKSITIDAGAGDDEISVSKLGHDQYEVDINGQKFVLSAEEMKNLTIKGGEGNDKIHIDESVDIALNIDGGAGDDVIVNHSNFSKIDGGEGNDVIVSLAHFVEIMGGEGSDVIYANGIGNEIYGDKKAETFWEMLFGTTDEADLIDTDGYFNTVHQ